MIWQGFQLCMEEVWGLDQLCPNNMQKSEQTENQPLFLDPLREDTRQTIAPKTGETRRIGSHSLLEQTHGLKSLQKLVLE